MPAKYVPWKRVLIKLACATVNDVNLKLFAMITVAIGMYNIQGRRIPFTQYRQRKGLSSRKFERSLFCPENLQFHLCFGQQIFG